MKKTVNIKHITLTYAQIMYYKYYLQYYQYLQNTIIKLLIRLFINKSGSQREVIRRRGFVRYPTDLMFALLHGRQLQS